MCRKAWLLLLLLLLLVMASAAAAIVIARARPAGCPGGGCVSVTAPSAQLTGGAAGVANEQVRTLLLVA
jgi:hypothetical protein